MKHKEQEFTPGQRVIATLIAIHLGLTVRSVLDRYMTPEPDHPLDEFVNTWLARDPGTWIVILKNAGAR